MSEEIGFIARDMIETYRILHDPNLSDEEKTKELLVLFLLG